MNNKKIDRAHKAATIIKNLEKRNMKGYYVETGAEAVELANSLVAPGADVSFGGSMTLFETGLIDSMHARNDITILDRYAAKNPEEMNEIFRKTFFCDTFFTSTNAITMEGELVNVDGTGNRIAAIIYGPKQVIILAGMNKVVVDQEEGIKRVHNVAAPQNCIRLNQTTPCSETGKCANCLNTTICNQTLITRRCGIKDRIKVILIGEDYGY